MGLYGLCGYARDFDTHQGRVQGKRYSVRSSPVLFGEDAKPLAGGSRLLSEVPGLSGLMEIVVWTGILR